MFVTFEHHHGEENAPEALNFLELIGKQIYIMWGQDITVKVLLSGKESNSHDRHVEEIDLAEPSHREEGNTVQILWKCFLFVFSFHNGFEQPGNIKSALHNSKIFRMCGMYEMMIYSLQVVLQVIKHSKLI